MGAKDPAVTVNCLDVSDAPPKWRSRFSHLRAKVESRLIVIAAAAPAASLPPRR
jgi:hypothetical protein